MWPCKWVSCPDAGEAQFVTAYRKRFTMDKDATIRVHVSADERYELYLDGVRVGRGSERGDRFNWFYETYDFSLAPGEHVFVARVWSLDTRAPFAQISVQPGFIFSPEGEFINLLGTGVVQWEAKKLGGYDFVDPMPAWGTGAKLLIDGSSYDWGCESGEGDGWKPVVDHSEGANGFIRNEYGKIHLMKPATLPAMLENEVYVGSVRYVSEVPSADTRGIAIESKNNLTAELDSWNLIQGKGSVTIPAHTKRRAIIDLENYYCAYPEMVTNGGKGSTIRVLWAESLFQNPMEPQGGGNKGNRNEIEGKYFGGVGDTFKPDGGMSRMFNTLWWEAGRYIELYVETTDQPLTIESFKLRETHYPFGMESKFSSSDERLGHVVPIAIRALQMCSHETYMDCPYYEQLMYVGDTRLEVLTTYAMTHDDRLPRKALWMYNASRLNSGITQSRYPSRVTQVIPPFSLWWVGMVYDYALWRNDQAYVKSLIPGVRGVIDCFRSFMNDSGLVEAPNGWNFMDWVGSWTWGIPPHGDKGVSGIINWQMVLALTMQAEMEEWLGELEMASRARRQAAELASRTSAAFWDDKRNLFADDISHQNFSEHAQCLALLSGQVDGLRRDKIAEALLTDQHLSRTTIYFTHYLFETYKLLGKADALFDRLNLWFELEKNGFKTTFEEPEPSRSDCHAWGAHPLYHYFTSILGIRPSSMGFRTVRIEPMLGSLTNASGKLVHPMGEIEVDFKVENGEIKGSVSLPSGVSGTFVSGAKMVSLSPGRQAV